MDLIERYVAEVGRHLPRKQREDVQTELRSLLQDMVEDRAQTKVDKADEEVITAVLLEMGPPQKVAASYQPRAEYLIGPQLYPVFRFVLFMVLRILVIVTFFSVLLSAWNSDTLWTDVPGLIMRAIPEVLGAVFSAFGSITLVFAILERVIPASEVKVNLDGADEEWDPRQLPPVRHTPEMNRSELIAGIVFGLIFLILFNGFPRWAGLIVIHDEQLTTVPLFSANFYANLLPWFNALLLVSMGVDIYKLRLRWQTRTTVLLDIGVSLFTAVVAYIFITNGPVFGVNAALAQTSNFSPENIDLFTKIFNTIENIALPLILLAELFSAGKKGYQLWRMPRDETMPTLVGKPG